MATGAAAVNFPHSSPKPEKPEKPNRNSATERGLDSSNNARDQAVLQQIAPRIFWRDARSENNVRYSGALLHFRQHQQKPTGIKIHSDCKSKIRFGAQNRARKLEMHF